MLISYSVIVRMRLISLRLSKTLKDMSRYFFIYASAAERTQACSLSHQLILQCLRGGGEEEKERIESN